MAGKTLGRGERGDTLVEMALVLPVFLLLILGVVDFGRAVVLYNMTSEGAREGARVAMVQAAVTSPAATPTVTLSSAQVTAVASAARNEAGPLGSSLQVQVTPGTDSGGGYVRVTVSGTFDPAAGRFLGINSIPVGASSKLHTG